MRCWWWFRLNAFSISCVPDLWALWLLPITFSLILPRDMSIFLDQSAICIWSPQAISAILKPELSHTIHWKNMHLNSNIWIWNGSYLTWIYSSKFNILFCLPGLRYVICVCLSQNCCTCTFCITVVFWTPDYWISVVYCISVL